MNTAPTYHRRTEDDTPPTTRITSAVTVNGNIAQKRFFFSGEDANGIDEFECKLDSASWYKCTNPATITVSIICGIVFQYHRWSQVNETSLLEHAFQVRAVDSYRNVDPTPATYSWSIDRAPPDTTIDSVKTVDNTGTDKRFIFRSSDHSSVARFECQLDGEQWTECTSPHTATVSIFWSLLYITWTNVGF